MIDSAGSPGKCMYVRIVCTYCMYCIVCMYVLCMYVLYCMYCMYVLYVLYCMYVLYVFDLSHYVTLIEGGYLTELQTNQATKGDKMV